MVPVAAISGCFTIAIAGAVLLLVSSYLWWP